MAQSLAQEPGMLGSGTQVWGTSGTTARGRSGESVQASKNETVFMTVLTGDFSFSDRKRNDQVERFKAQAIHVTHWDIGLFGDLKTGSSGHWVKWTTVWASEATGVRATGNLSSQCSQDLGRWRPVWNGLRPTGPKARAEP